MLWTRQSLTLYSASIVSFLTSSRLQFWTRAMPRLVPFEARLKPLRARNLVARHARLAIPRREKGVGGGLGTRAAPVRDLPHLVQFKTRNELLAPQWGQMRSKRDITTKLYHNYPAVIPPSTGIAAPVMKLESSLAKKRTKRAISSAAAIRPIGCLDAQSCAAACTSPYMRHAL